jgi:hypothetical protein
MEPTRDGFRVNGVEYTAKQLNAPGVLPFEAEGEGLATAAERRFLEGDVTPEQLGALEGIAVDDLDLPEIELERYQRGELLDLEGPAREDWGPGSYREGEGADAMQGALDYMAEVGVSGTDAVSDRAMEQRRLESLQLEQAQRGAILEEAQRRGFSGMGGLEAQQRMASQQSGADRDRMAGLESEAMAQQRRDASQISRGNLGATMAGGRDAYDSAMHASGQENLNNIANVNNTEASVNWGNEKETRDKNTELQHEEQYNEQGTVGTEWNAGLARAGLIGGSGVAQAGVDLEQLREQNRREEANNPWNKYVLPAIQAGGAVAQGVAGFTK